MNIQQAFAILNVPENSDMETVKRRYKQLARKTHPDLGGNSEDFMAIKEAYDAIKSVKSVNIDDEILDLVAVLEECLRF